MDQLDAAARMIAEADALLITAGAGMGVDSGLPDFRGAEGFWNAYPAYRALGLRFDELAQPNWFRSDPGLAWGFYGHRLELYRATLPHEGYSLLRRWSDEKALGAFVFTSNVDAHFARADFPEERIYECHGSLFHAQCMENCGIGVFSAADFRVDVDPSTFRANAPLPGCRACGALARPNVMMFNDWDWDDARAGIAAARLDAWLQQVGDARLAIVELGAGTTIPSVRMVGERFARRPRARLIRINLREAQVRPPDLSVTMGALAALQAIDRKLAAYGDAPQR